jgi:hypothetical protein
LLADISERFPADRGAIMGSLLRLPCHRADHRQPDRGFAADWRGIDGMLIATAGLLAIAVIPALTPEAQEHEIDAGAPAGQPGSATA